jgi:hypothetical protein
MNLPPTVGPTPFPPLTLKDPLMRLTNSENPVGTSLGCLRVLALAVVIAGLTACATHRADPPKCKGPFTPINQSSPGVSNGAQR